jgi:hypothetical protein
MANEVELLKDEVIVHEANTGVDEPANLDLAQQHAVIEHGIPRAFFSTVRDPWAPWDNTNLPWCTMWNGTKWELRAKP